MLSARAKRTRAVVVLASLGVAGSAIAWRIRGNSDPTATAVVDLHDSLNRLLEDRGRTPPPAPGTNASYPPPLVREPIDEATAQKLFPSIGGGRYVYDPVLCLRSASNLSLRREFAEHPAGGWAIRTNAFGMREDGEPSAVRPDLRILAAGASNVEGLCANSESAINLLEVELRRRLPGKTIEALNAGVGSSSLYNYLLILERYRELRPDVFVLVVNGGTDFVNGLVLDRYFNRRGPWLRASLSCDPLLRSDDAFLRQLPGTELGQVVHLIANPTDFAASIDFACSVTAEIEGLCRADGIRFLCAYLPPPLAGQPGLLERERKEVLERLPLTSEQLDVSDRLADRWLAFLRDRGVEHVDLRAAWRAATERLYWRTDPHIPLAGQRSVAEALLDSIDRR